MYAHQIPHIAKQWVIKGDLVLVISDRYCWHLYAVVHRVVLDLSYWELQLFVIDHVPLHSFQFHFLLHIANLQNTRLFLHILHSCLHVCLCVVCMCVCVMTGHVVVSAAPGVMVYPY